MKVFKSTTSWDFLFNESWHCDYLKASISEALQNGKKSTELALRLNAYVDDVFCNVTYVSQTQLNDFLRFNYVDIMKAMRLEEFI